MPQATSLRDLMRIRAHNRAYLDSINGNLGTALGFRKPTGLGLSDQPAIIVFVPLKVNPKWIPNSQLIPDTLLGPDGLTCALDVVEGGRAETEKDVPQSDTELAEQLRGWSDHVWAGSQVAHWVNQAQGMYSMGTIGAFVRRRGTGGALGFLTNQHVGIAAGTKLFHPVPWGTPIGTTDQVIEYIADQAWYGPFIDEPNTFVRSDCAFVRMASTFSQADINPQMLGIGQLGTVKTITLNDMFPIGQKVVRVGRTTGLRRGTVVGFGYEFTDNANRTEYTDLLIIGDDDVPFSTHGDSGSLILLDNPQHDPLALLWGGWQEKLRTGHAQENWTYGIALSRVLDALAIDLVTSL